MVKRNPNDKVIAGVCSGLAKSLEIDPIIMRLVFVVGFVAFGIGPIIYLLLWLLMHKEEEL
jgi:phage shock protein PspC (stress-responsive transcriptional regulator)